MKPIIERTTGALLAATPWRGEGKMVCSFDSNHDIEVNPRSIVITDLRNRAHIMRFSRKRWDEFVRLYVLGKEPSDG